MTCGRLKAGFDRVILGLTMAVHLATALPASAASQITTSTSSGVFNSGAKFYAHCSNGYYWVALRDGSSTELFSSIDGVTWTPRGSIFSFNPGVNEWAVRYQADVIIGFAYNSGDSIRYYRKGTLNADGTISWNAAEVAVGAPDASSIELNALIANGKPVLWRAGPSDAGYFTIGDQLDSPVVWTDTPSAPSLGPASIPGNGTNGQFSAGAIFSAGGADPDDLIVLRSTSASAAALGSHRLVSVKYDASLDAFDTEWYNVSTIGGSLAEDNSTEVAVHATDEESHRRFAAVKDSSGSLHAVYKNQLSDIVHYRKDPGFNDSWTRLGTDVVGDNGSKVGLSAAASDSLYLFFETTGTPNVLQMQRYDGVAWGSATTLFSGTDLQKSLGVMEQVGNCAPAVAFTHGNLGPFDVLFSVDTTSCTPLNTSEGSGTITVTAPGSFEMTFDTSAGGSIESFFDLVEDPGKTTDLAAGTNPEGLHNFGIRSASTNYNTTTDSVSASIYLLEATPTRVQVRQHSGYEANNTDVLLAGIRGIGTYSIYPSGRIALNHRRIAQVTIPFENEYTELVVHYTSAATPLDTWSSNFQNAGTGVGTGNDDFTLTENQVAGSRADFLQILAEEWVAGPKHQSAATLTDRTFNVPADRLNAYWYDGAGGTISAGAVEVFDSLTYFRPNFIDHTDPQVTTRSSDYRAPDDISVADFALGSRWDEDGNNDGFNEAEAVYTIDADPTNGLTFDMDGSSTTRYSPFFKIRQWRSLADPASVTLEGVSLTSDVEYRADVKPLSRAHESRDIIWYSTLEDPTAFTAPDVGSPANTIGTPAQATGRFGGGYFFNGLSDALRFGNNGFTADYGMVEFWVQPQSAHTDGANRTFWYNQGSGGAYFRIRKTSANNLELEVNDGGSTALVQISSANFSWVAGEWLHLRAIWDDNQAAGLQIRLFVNGREPVHTDSGTYNGAAMSMTWNHIGNDTTGTPFANAVIDELALYNNAFAPFERANGGLTSSSSEYLASTTNNWQPGLFAVDAEGRGGYIYLGTDARFRGLNISLAQTGIGSPDLVWEYWNGTRWADLESVTGFTDELNDLTEPDGTIYWTADPPNWSPYSVVGGPELYYVRVHGSSSHSYTTFPTEALIKTDILLVAYCGDISATAQTFDFTLPAPTSVELVAFEGRSVDGAVELTWETATELDNLGFHVYRTSASSGGSPRITPRAIPGLGSSPMGARYRYRDERVVVGETYHYELEDIETTGVTKRHGPVTVTVTVVGAGHETGGVAPNEIAYGLPDDNTVRTLKRRANGVVVELVTAGFFAEPLEDGAVSLRVPGLDADDGLPVKRVWIDVPDGHDVVLKSVRARDVRIFSSLRPAADKAELVATVKGGVRLRRRGHERSNVSTTHARVVDVAVQGARNKALVEFSPFSWNGEELSLATRVYVRLSFKKPPRRARARRGGSVWRLTTTEPGLYAHRLRTRASELRLRRRGIDVPFHVEGRTLFFVGAGGGAVYELEAGVAGARMPTQDSQRGRPSPTSLWHTERHEESVLYQAALVTRDDPWLWDALFAPVTKSYPFDASGLVEGPAFVRVWLQGTSDFETSEDHHVRISINGRVVSETRFDGKEAIRLDGELAAGVLQEVGNVLEVDNVGDTEATYSMVMLDAFEVDYRRAADAEQTAGLWHEPATVDAAWVVDTTDDPPRWIRGARLEAGRRYIVADSTYSPSVYRVERSPLSQPRRADWIVIGPRAFLEAFAPVIAHRRRQGLNVQSVSTEDIYDAFGGEESPEAIREFLRFAYHEWKKPSYRYVALLGDGSYDSEDHLKTGTKNHVPPVMIRTSYLWTASDPVYAAVNGDDLLPDVAIGRLPAASVDDVRRMAHKILDYESRGGPARSSMAIVTDDPDDAGNFEHHANELAHGVLAPFSTRKLLLSQLGRDGLRDAVRATLDDGVSVMSYVGHGGIHLWAEENVFNTDDVAALSPSAELPLLLTLNCLNGYFHFPYFDSLAEAMVKADGKGAIAAFSPSGLSLDGPAHLYHEVLLDELVSGRHARVGDAVLRAQERFAESGAMPELLGIYHLFGDPALPLAIQR